MDGEELHYNYSPTWAVFGYDKMPYIGSCRRKDYCLNILSSETSDCDQVQGSSSFSSSVFNGSVAMGRVRNNRYYCMDLSKKHTGIENVVISENRRCDLECDCVLCDDEMYCDGVLYGMQCLVKSKAGRNTIQEYIG